MIATTKVYKIRNKKTGLYSAGGSDVLFSSLPWNKNGKIWKTRGHVKNHLTQAIEQIRIYRSRKTPDGQVHQRVSVTDLELITYEIKEVEVTPAVDCIDLMALLGKQ